MRIKFNMDFHGEYIRTLKGLRENFSVEDVLEVYNNGQLVKWLDARLFMNELKQVQAITSTNAREILAELIKIFEPETKPEEIDEALTIYDYLKEREDFRKYMKENGLQELESLREKLTLRDNEIARLKQDLEDIKREYETYKKSNNILAIVKVL